MIGLINRVISGDKVTSRWLKHRYLDNFIFVHINKTGGSSVARALNIPFEHKTALEKIEEMGCRKWERCLTFTVIRNPWDKVVSHYHYRVKTNQTALQTAPIPFNEWVQHAYGQQDPLYYDQPKMFMPQTDWIADKNGRILVDEIIHFENLDDEFNKLMQKLGKHARLPHLNKSRHGDYREYYDEATAEIVRNWFKKDIINFRYEFSPQLESNITYTVT